MCLMYKICVDVQSSIHTTFNITLFLDTFLFISSQMAGLMQESYMKALKTLWLSQGLNTALFVLR